MVKNLKAMLIFCAAILLFISCKKDIEPVIPTEPPIETVIPGDDTASSDEQLPTDDPEEKPTSPEEVPNNPGESTSPLPEESTSPLPEEKPSVDNPIESLPGQGTNSIEMGTGAGGDLTIDGNSANLKGKNLITIKAGTYNSIVLKNLSGSINTPIFIKNSGQVIIKGYMETHDITNVTFAGDNTPGIQYGFNFNDIPYRAIVMSGKMDGVTLKNLSFRNVRDYVIFGGNSKLSYQGTESTRTERFKILNSKFDATGGILFGGNLGSDGDTGFIKDVEIAHNIFENTSWGILAQFSNVQDYNVHHNILNNVNTSNNEHNGIFLMIGNGKFHDNKFTNYQGNAIRAWVYSRGSTPAMVEIYNNITYNTRKYGAFELQGFDRYIVPGKSTYVNAKVYNNTVGKMNTSKEWEGVVLDLLNYGGTLEYYNNLGYDLYHTKSIGDMINNYSDVKIIRNENNKYFSTSSEAVTDLSSFNSKHSSIGAKL